MAGFKSSEDIFVFECVNCKGEFHTKSKNCTDGMRCPKCKGYLNPKRIETHKNENEIVRHAKYTCFSCGHTDDVWGKRKDYKEVRICPKCKGLYVDTWKLGKYDHLRPSKKKVGELTIDLDVSNALKGLKTIQREARKTIKLLKEVERLTNNKEVANNGNQAN